MAASITLATFIATAVTNATARGITDPEHLSRIRTEAADHWASDLNSSYSGEPRGSSAAN